MKRAVIALVANSLHQTAILPAIFFVVDNAAPVMEKFNMGGNLGYRMGIGQTPQLRVLSFYEKHAPDKLGEVPKIMGKYYGDYGKLTKSLERKYQDYGYFLGWEKDEAPSTLAWAKLDDTYKAINKKFKKHAPAPVRTAASNAYFNINKLVKQGRKIWKKHLAPHLGVPSPEEAEKQKRKDRAASGKGGKKKRGGKHKFRDEEDDEM